MDFYFPEHSTRGVLNGDDLTFFYYDIGLDHIQSSPLIYDWDSVATEFKGILDIEASDKNQIPDFFEINKIRFNVSKRADSDNGSISAAFFRHLRNAFAHYRIVREGENYVITDGEPIISMRGLVNAELLKKFCFRLFEMRERIISEYESPNNVTL